MKTLLHMLRIRRVEFRIAEIPILLIPVLLSAQNPAVFRTAVFWELALIFGFLFAFGDMINCLADRDLDAVYKKKLSEAVYGLGVRFVKLQIAFSALVAGLLTIHLAWTLQRWSLLALLAAGIVLGAAYSVEPIRLKRRGLWASLCLWLIIFVGPMLLAVATVSSQPSWPVLLLACTYGLQQIGVTLVNTAEDYPEDLEAGLKTSVIALGLERGIALAGFCALAGCVGTTVILAYLLNFNSASLLALVPTVLVGTFVCLGICQLALKIRHAPLSAAIDAVKARAKFVPLWFTLNAWAVCTTAYCIYLANGR